jgi:hypothetical protein
LTRWLRYDLILLDEVGYVPLADIPMAASGTEDYKWRACLIPCWLVFEKGNHRTHVIGNFLKRECQQLFSYSPPYGPCFCADKSGAESDA